MRYVILRDDDTNALTPVECLERLYRPFLDRYLPVNLAVIPAVSTSALTPDGKTEGFLFAKNGANKPGTAGVPPAGSSSQTQPSTPLQNAETTSPSPIGWERAGVRVDSSYENPHNIRTATVPIGDNSDLVKYLRENADYHVVQHGCHHDCFEFDRKSPSEIAARLEQGTKFLRDAGFPRPVTFVAPHDKLSRASYREVAKRFQVISSGWFELERLPLVWWPKYFAKKARQTPHWRVNGTLLLSHPGCLLSAQRDYNSMLDEIKRSVNSRKVTVLVTHWWEYFPGGKPNESFIQVLHETADYLASEKDIKVISFSELAKSGLQLN